MKKRYNDATLALRLPEELDKQLKSIAEQKSIALGSLCRMVLAEWVQNNAGKVLVDAVANKPKPTAFNRPATQKPIKRERPDDYDLYIRSLSKLEDTPKLDENGEVDDWL
jgi:hypothetical protein